MEERKNLITNQELADKIIPIFGLVDFHGDYIDFGLIAKIQTCIISSEEILHKVYQERGTIVPLEIFRIDNDFLFIRPLIIKCLEIILENNNDKEKIICEIQKEVDLRIMDLKGVNCGIPAGEDLN